MSLASPVDQKFGGSGYGSSGQSESGKSPLSMSLGFLKNLTEKKNPRGKCDVQHTPDRSTNEFQSMDNLPKREDLNPIANPHSLVAKN